MIGHKARSAPRPSFQRHQASASDSRTALLLSALAHLSSQPGSQEILAWIELVEDRLKPVSHAL
ncbi:MAG TPA: hypothetical protein VLB76_21810 [Thermoanaerobaculia bacterium]|nr:hypothetical protein [Thermoanaerobaculia bacterium]